MGKKEEVKDMTHKPCTPNDSVKWNPYNNVVQCHRCGQIYIAED